MKWRWPWESKPAASEAVVIERWRVMRTRCPICGKVFEDGDMILRHIGTLEAWTRPIVHAKCGMGFGVPGPDLNGPDRELAVALTDAWQAWVDAMEKRT